MPWRTPLHGILFYFAALSSAAYAEEPRCLPPTEAESFLPAQTVSPDLADLKAKYNEVYASGRRLEHRAYRSGETFVLPEDKNLVKIPEKFIANLTRHIEIALARGYADFLFYSDMGHGHLLFPKEQKPENKEALLSSPDLKILYHTGELLTLRSGKWFDGPLPSEPTLAWRYFSRNFLADNIDGQNLAVLVHRGPGYNTVREIEGYAEQDTFRVSASKDGCFPFRRNGKTYYFDLSIQR